MTTKALTVAEAIADLEAGERDLRDAARIIRATASNYAAPRSKRRTSRPSTVWTLVTLGLRHVADGLESQARETRRNVRELEPYGKDEIVVEGEITEGF